MIVYLVMIVSHFSTETYVVGTHKNCVYLEFVVYCMQV